MIVNKEVIQSYILTTAKYEYSVYEKRILYKIVEMLQDMIKGKKLNQKYNLQKTLFNDWHVTMPISGFLKDEGDKNYAQAKAALKSLQAKLIEYEDERIWQSISIISNPEINKYGETVTFRLHERIVGALMDFSKGFSKYELITAMRFESTYSMRFYELLSGQKKPITYSVLNLKIMFKIENKYERVNDFFRKVIDVAKKEMDAKSPYSFDYKPIKKGRAITSIMFYPIAKPENNDAELAEKKAKKQVSLYWDLDKITIQYLKENYLFTDTEIKNNLTVFKDAQNEIDFMYFLSENRIKAEKKGNPKGWIINAIKKQLGGKVQKTTPKTAPKPERKKEAVGISSLIKDFQKLQQDPKNPD